MAGVRVGIVGTGFGARVVAPTLSGAGLDVVDVVSPRDDAAVAALCTRADIDLVSVHSPPFLHATHVQWALDAGHAVLCDKPFGRSAEEAAGMVAAADQAGALNLLNFEFRHEPARVRVKEMLDGGAIGTPEHLQWSALTSGSRVPLRRHGWLFDRSLGGGWLGAWGSHAIDAVRWLLGEVTAAGAANRVTIAERPDRDGVMRACDAEDAFTGWMTVEGGATVGIDTSFATTVTLPTHIAICGSEGTIDITNDHRIVLRRADGTKDEIELPPRTGDPHAGALGAWAHVVARAVGDGEQVAPSFADGLACRRVLDAMSAGWEGGRLAP
jgi:predicted dehydrogenase